MSMTPLELERLAEIVAEKVARKIADSPRQQLPEALVDVHAAAELLNISVPTVERLTKSGAIPSIKVGRLRRYRPSTLLGPKGGAA